MPKINCVCAICQKPFQTYDTTIKTCGRACGYKFRHLPNQRPAVDRFWEKVSKGGPDECWEWQGYLSPKGYGAFSDDNGRIIRTHRFALELVIGPIPPGYLACHKCDNPKCCNERHLFKGTPKDNTQDMMSKGRNRNKTFRGEESASCKFPWDLIKEMRELYATNKYTQKEIARTFNISLSYAKGILRKEMRVNQ